MSHNIINNLPVIKAVPSKSLIGKHLTMCFANNTTFKLWSSFMPVRHNILNAVSTDLYSVQVYPDGFFEDFDANAEFAKWAAVEVSNLDDITAGMESFILPAGLYAVFGYKGKPEDGAETFKYILQEWLPQSGYTLDNRPHFEVLGAKYKNGDMESEEEIWIPIK